MNEEVFPSMPKCCRKQIKYFTDKEFCPKITTKKPGGEIETTILSEKEAEEISNKYNNADFDPLDGTLVKLCDDVGAFLEAYNSETYGVRSRYLSEGIARIRNIYNEKDKKHKVLGKIDTRLFLQNIQTKSPIEVACSCLP